MFSALDLDGSSLLRLGEYAAIFNKKRGLDGPRS